MDLFADYNNAKFDTFMSRYICPDTDGVDAFTISWDGLHVWLCPPTSTLISVITKISLSTAAGILIVPIWRASLFWPFISPDGRHINVRFQSAIRFRPFLLSSDYYSASYVLMQGRTPFSFLALYFDACPVDGFSAGNFPVPESDMFSI